MQLFNKSSLRETEFNANNYWQKWPRVNSLPRTFGKEYNSKGRKNHNKTFGILTRKETSYVCLYYTNFDCQYNGYDFSWLRLPHNER